MPLQWFNHSWQSLEELRWWKVMLGVKLQALVYDILPSTTAVFSYAIGPRKLSANEQFFVGTQTVVSLLQTTHIISDVCFILPCCLRQLKSKPKSFEMRRNFLFIPGVDASHVYVRAWALASSVLSVPKPFGGR